MEDFVTYDLALKLKDKGFNWICSHYYRTKCKDLFMVFPSEDWSNTEERIIAPTISQVINWLESTKKIFLTVDIEPMGFFFIINYDILTNENGEYEFKIYNSTNTYPSSFEAAIEGINYILNNFI